MEALPRFEQGGEALLTLPKRDAAAAAESQQADTQEIDVLSALISSAYGRGQAQPSIG